MSIASTDLVLFASASVPDDDVTTSGGAIDTLRRLDFTQLAADDDIEVISDSASDTQNCTITARDAAGVIVTETAALTGTSAKIFSTLGVVNRVLQVELASVAIGTITVRRSVAGATVRTIPIGERGFMAVFRKCASDPSSTVDYFCKGFFKNTHGTLSLTSAAVKQNADPSAKITHALDASIDASTSVADRLTDPGFTFNDSDKTVPGGGVLAAGEAIGVWFKLSLTAGDSAYNSTYTVELAGQSA